MTDSVSSSTTATSSVAQPPTGSANAGGATTHQGVDQTNRLIIRAGAASIVTGTVHGALRTFSSTYSRLTRCIPEGKAFTLAGSAALLSVVWNGVRSNANKPQ